MEKYSANTIEEAIEVACNDKNCKSDELKYRLLETTDISEGNVTIEAYCLNDIKEFLFDYLGNFFVEVDPDGIEMEINLNKEEESFHVNLNSNNNAVYIGKAGLTLKAINTIANSAVSSVFKHRYPVFVDINNYKHHRYSRLVRSAKNVAKNVQKTHIEAHLDPMPNDERKVIHQALQNWKNISTQSEGEGATRHIVLKYIDPSEQVEETISLGSGIDLSDETL